jgi:electron transport complex protein RnfD
MDIIKETSPHLHRKDTLRGMMIDVIIALAPVLIFAYAVYTWDAVRNVFVSILLMCGAEFFFVLIRDKGSLKNYTLNNFLVPLVSALIYALISPAKTDNIGITWVSLISGALFGIIIGKLVFGGTGQNIFNPAAVGMVFSKLCFGQHYIYQNTWYSDVEAGGTSLSGGSYSFLDLFLGKCPGTIGEVCKLAILLGLAYLLIRKAADWRIVVSYLGTFAFLMLFAGIIYQAGGKTENAGSYLLSQLLSGGLLFGATYMATEPVTSPMGRPGRLIYGVILGSVNVMIRLFGSYPEGTVFSILIGNMLSPVIDYYKWASNKYSWKNILWMIAIPVATLLVVVWALCVEVL